MSSQDSYKRERIRETRRANRAEQLLGDHGVAIAPPAANLTRIPKPTAAPERKSCGYQLPEAA